MSWLKPATMNVFNRIYWMARTWYWRSRFVESMGASLNRRVSVENILRGFAARGESPSPETCRNLANELSKRTGIRW